MTNIHLTPGPTEIHEVAKEAIRDALHSDICSISHRSKEFEELLLNTEGQLRQLLSIPLDYQVFFLGSGTESWERIIQNGVFEKSYHLINGSFSKRFYETALELGKVPAYIEKEPGQGFEISDLPSCLEAEMICVTQNETSTGVCLPDQFLPELRKLHPGTLIAVDAVSSAPYPKLDLSLVDYYFFSVQKFFCLPAGLGVLIVSPNALAKAKELKQKGLSIGCHHSFLSLEEYVKKHQTPSTPNVLGIYTLGIVSEHFNLMGIEALRKETEEKANLLYDCLDRNSEIEAFVTNPSWRSKTVITVNSGSNTKGIISKLAANGLNVGLGYGKLKDSQFRVANFSAHSLDSFERLCQLLA